MVESYTLGLEAIRQIRRIVREEMLTPRPASRTPTVQPTPPNAIYAGYTGVGGIAAQSGDTPGSAAVTIKQLGASGDWETVKDGDGSDLTRTVYNMSQSAVAASAYVQIKQESVRGALLVDFEDCG